MAITNEIPSKSEDAVRNGAISLDDVLDDGETISAITSISATPSGLTFASEKVNTSVIQVVGQSVAIGRAVQFRVSGGSAGQLYQGVVTITTNATPAQTIPVPFRLLVV